MQAPFSNLSFDLTCPKDMENEPVIIGGQPQDFTYGDCKEEMERFTIAFCKVMVEGDATGKPFTFPIPTFSITEDFPFGSKLSEAIFTFANEANIPYFSNFINSDNSPSDVRSMCCRLRLNLTELRKKAGGLFGAGDKTGSIGVVTLNLSRMGYIAKILVDETNANPRDVATAKKILKDNFPILYEDLVSLPKVSKVDIFMEILDYFLSIAKNALVAKRRYCDKTLEMGMLPYTKRYLGHFNNHFNTISVNAGHECCLNLFGKGIDDPECRAFMQSVLDHILDKCKKFQEEDGDILYNLEAAPAESCGTRFAKSDRKDFEDIVTGEGTNGTFYTNSTMLPESYSENIFAVCEHQDGLIDKYTGGSVIHIYMNEPLPSWKIAENLIRKIFTNYRIPYMSISPDLCICPIHGRLPKSYDYCPYEHSQEDIDRLVKQGVLSKDDIVLIE